MADTTAREDGKHHTSHREAKNGGHDPGGHASQAVITITHYKASDSDDGDEKHHTPHRTPKMADMTPAGEDEKHHTWLPDAKNAVCEVCGQSFTWSGRGQPARYCSRTCQMKAYRQRQSSVDAPGQGVPVPTAMEQADSGPPDPSVCLDCGKPITDPGFSYRCPRCLKARLDRFARPYPEKLIDWLQQQEGRSLVEQGPDDIIEWGERLLAELRAGRVQLPVVEIKPGHAVLVPERFLASHIAEAKLGIDAATENLRRYQRALELVSERKQQQHGR
jgi:hypothetical protein